jgi:hypothetical protein
LLSCKIRFHTRPSLIFLPNVDRSFGTHPTILTTPCPDLPYTAAPASRHLLPSRPSHATPDPILVPLFCSTHRALLSRNSGRLGRLLDLSTGQENQAEYLSPPKRHLPHRRRWTSKPSQKTPGNSLNPLSTPPTLASRTSKPILHPFPRILAIYPRIPSRAHCAPRSSSPSSPS